MIETLAAVVLVAMMAVALMQTATIVRVAHRRSSETSLWAERALVELRGRALASRARLATEGRLDPGASVAESSLDSGGLDTGDGSGWIVVYEGDVGVAVWCGRVGDAKQ